jgi:hypothetical protein
MLNSSAALASDATQLTRGRFGSALFNPYLVSWFTAHPPSSGLTTPVGDLLQRHALTLFVRLHAGDSRRSRFDVTGFCVCLHALSSFQRTDFPKAPWVLPPPLALPSTLLSSLAAGLADRAQGNLLRLLSLLSLVNHFLPLFFQRLSDRGRC